MSNRTKLPADAKRLLFIPLGKLKKSPKNVRKIPHTKAEIKAIAASIAAVGLLQNLVVEPETGSSGKPTGLYLVNAGEGRRLAQLLRVKRKEIKADEPIRCFLDTEHSATEISLAENAIRTEMHPADQYEAFAKLNREHGMSAEDIAARFGVTAAVVKQRLKLGAISPKLIRLYREGELNLDQLTAFAITDDHAAQERVWGELSFNKSREAILQALSEGQVPVDDRRAVFIGDEAYQAAGGTIIRDLFDEDGGGFFADAALLNRLVREKLQRKAHRVLAEGWNWVSVEPEYDYSLTAGMRRIHPALSPEDQAKMGALEARLNALEDDDESSADRDRLESEMEALTAKERYQPDELARAGAFICLGHDGEPRIERGFIRREDEAALEQEPGDGEESEAEVEAGRPMASGALSDKLVAELTGYRTSGLRNAFGQNPAVALTAVVHALALSVFYDGDDDASCLQLLLRTVSLSSHAPGIAESPAERETSARHEAWAKRLPRECDGLWDFIASLAESERLNLLAHCAAFSINAVRAKGEGASGRHGHADTLAQALTLDMADCWQPTAASYFGRVSKEQIVEAVRGGVSEQAAQGIDHLRKPETAAAAEKLLSGKRWLPALLRTPQGS